MSAFFVAFLQFNLLGFAEVLGGYDSLEGDI